MYKERRKSTYVMQRGETRVSVHWMLLSAVSSSSGAVEERTERDRERFTLESGAERRVEVVTHLLPADLAWKLLLVRGGRWIVRRGGGGSVGGVAGGLERRRRRPARGRAAVDADVAVERRPRVEALNNKAQHS